MDHADHVALIRDGLDGAGPRWLELGAGSGAFTLALVDLLGDAARVVALDRDAAALRTLEQATAGASRRASVRTIVGDFTRPMPVEPASFDGVLMANSLHFVRDKVPVLRAAIDTLRPGGRFLIVEYGSDRGNPWVPWPIGYASWEKLAARGWPARHASHRRGAEPIPRLDVCGGQPLGRPGGSGSGDGPPTRPAPMNARPPRARPSSRARQAPRRSRGTAPMPPRGSRAPRPRTRWPCGTRAVAGRPPGRPGRCPPR